MAGLDDLLGGLLGGQGDNAGGAGGLDLTKLIAMAGPLLGMIQSKGGLGSILGQLQQGPMAGAVDSWIGTGENQAVAPDQLADALGRDNIDQLAQQSGLSADEVQSSLSQLLPKVVDGVTPEGSLPTGSALDDALSNLLSRG
jgi:uncharacterized protein YidB (DUF937 family)